MPYAFVLTFRYGEQLWEKLRATKNFQPALVSTCVILHLLVFTLATQRHLTHTNQRQKALMELAESVTDSNSDPVYDGIGLVPDTKQHSFPLVPAQFKYECFYQRPRTAS